MKFRLLAVIVLITTVFFSSLIWLLDSFFYGDRGSWAEMSLRTQVTVTSEAVSNEAKFLQRWVSFANEDKLKQINWTAFSPYVAVGVLQKSGTGWIVMEWAAEPKSAWAKVTKEGLQSTMQSFSPKNVDRAVSFFSFVDAEKRASVFSIVPTSHRTWIFVHGGEALQTVIDSQKGSWSSLGIINRDGLTLAHSIPEYVGQKMAKSNLQQDLMKGETVSGAGTYDMGENTQVFAYFQKVPDVDAYVYSTMPVAEVMKGRKKLLLQLALLALGLILTTSSFILKFSNQTSTSFRSENESEDNPSVPASAPGASDRLEAKMENGSLQKGKMEAYAKMASAVGHELRAPLLAIMGYGQSLLEKVKEPESKKMIESLIDEARASRTVLDKLFIFSGEKNSDRLQVKVETPLLRALKNLEPLLSQKRVKLVKDIKETQPISLNSENLTRAFENILLNSIESMERQAHKEIQVKLQDTGSFVEVAIQDKGEGIDPKNIKKIYEPFFTTRSARQQLGLGLSVSHGVFKDHSAEMDVHSQLGQGTKVTIRFEKIAAAKKAPVPAEKTTTELQTHKKKAEKMDLPANIPKFKEIELEAKDEAKAPGEEAVSEEFSLMPLSENEDSFVMSHSVLTNTENILLNPKPNSTPAPMPTPAVTKDHKPSLDVNVDQLLDLPEDKPDEEKTLLTSNEMTEAPAPLIGPPKKPATQKYSAVEEFKVVVRRPERKS